MHREIITNTGGKEWPPPPILGKKDREFDAPVLWVGY